jgi:Protein of unknown function (DUF2523)
MPYLAGLIWGALLLILESLIGKIIGYLAISYVTYQGVDFLLQNTVSSAMSFLQVNSELAGFIGLTRIDQCISVITSAVVVKYTLAGLNSGAVTKVKLK